MQGVDIPIFIKNPVNTDLELWVGAFERLNNAGITRLGAIHRGFSTTDKNVYRNSPQWHIPIELKRRFPDLPILCDPSHIGGSGKLIKKISQQAMDLNFKGLVIEAHCNPKDAWSDSNQQVTPKELKSILESLVIRETTQSTEDLSDLRSQIDEIDNSLLELLSKRMRISREIGTYKIEHKMPILQTVRYDEILTNRVNQAQKMDMSSLFAKKFLEAIHEESVRQQMEVMHAENQNNNQD